jgi:hypothetical protein
MSAKNNLVRANTYTQTHPKWWLNA